MTASDAFAHSLDDLMERTLANNDKPLPRMIYELEMAKARIVNLQLARERQMAIAESAKMIIPANGKLPPPLIEGRG